MPVITLYNGKTGDSCVAEAGGSGGGSSRAGSWLTEVSRWLKEAVEPTFLKGLGLGLMANYPVFLNGRGRESHAIGNNAPIQDFAGVDLFKVVQNTLLLGTGDNSAVSFGNEELTVSDVTHANYYNTTTDPEDPAAPVGASAPAFLQTLVDGGGFNLAATDGVLTVVVNGVSYSVSGLTGTAVTAEAILSAIVDAGWPVNAAVEGTDTLRLFTLGLGNAQTIMATGEVAAVIYTGGSQSSNDNILYRGNGGPLTDVRASSDGIKPQRRILPGSVTVTAVTGSTLKTGVDDVITSGNTGEITGTGITAGTINYLTGAIDVEFAAAVAAAADVTAMFKALVPLNLHEQVRVPRAGMAIAMILRD